MMHLPGGNLFTFLFFHLETIKHAFGWTSVVMKDCVPKAEQSKVRFFARIHAILWTITIGASIYFQTWFPITVFTFTFCIWDNYDSYYSIYTTCWVN